MGGGVSSASLGEVASLFPKLSRKTWEKHFAAVIADKIATGDLTDEDIREIDKAELRSVLESHGVKLTKETENGGGGTTAGTGD